MTAYTIFIFRRDLRIVDNTTLNYVMNTYDNVVPIFIFTPEQITKKNKYKSDNAIQFMIESLQSVDKDLKKHKSKLHLFIGKNDEILKKICNKINVECIAFNMDYTPYAIKRDKKIKKLCKSLNIECVSKEDYLLRDMGVFLKKNGDPYTIFTPFKNNGLTFDINKPSKVRAKNLVRLNKLPTTNYIDHPININILVHGGRDQGVKQLAKVKNHKDYDKTRNMVDIPTTHLSAFIKFGCVSIREVFWKVKRDFGKHSALMGRLFWREFYYYIVYYFPRVLKGENFNQKYDKIQWESNRSFLHKWQQGKTGYPIVDAGMIQLNTTGYMHNRARLITSNFLNRLLGMDWTVGEKYFAQQLTDYDPAVNNGNWQWIASTGTDPKPYFQRLFNPILQSEKFDPDADYIKTWLPQLNNIPAKELHKWGDYYQHYNLKEINYVAPIVDYKQARAKSVAMYRKVL